MNKSKMNVKQETQIFLQSHPNDNDDIDEVHHRGHSVPSTRAQSAAKSGPSRGKRSRWDSIRNVLLGLAALLFIAVVVAMILLGIFYPRCPHKTNLDWWQKEISYQIEVSNFRDSNGDGIGDINGVISELDYLEKLGIRTLILSRAISKETPRKFDPEYAADTQVADELKAKLKEKNMHLVIDIPASFLDQNGQETIEYWLYNHADGIRITNFDDYNSDQSVQTGLLNKWHNLADNIYKKTQNRKLITAYPNDLKSLKYERRFLKLIPEHLVDQAKFTSDIESMYSSLDKAMWPVLVLGEYDSLRLKNTFGDNKLSRLVHGLVLLLRGTPLVLFGDEIELTAASEYENTMQWNSADQGCGFTSNSEVGVFFRGATNNCANNVEETAKKSSSLIQLYQNLAPLRSEAAFQYGDVKTASQGNENVISFVRELKDHDSFLVAANAGDQAVTINFKEKHSLASSTAVVNVVYSINEDELADLKLDDNVQTNSVQVAAGQLLVLRLKKLN